MAEFKTPFRNIRIVLCRTKPLTKVVVIAAIVLSMTAMIALRLTQEDIEAQTEEARAKAAALEYANQQLEEKKEGLGSVYSDMEIAQEELGLVDPDAIFFKAD